MIPELGNFALILSLCFALWQTILPYALAKHFKERTALILAGSQWLFVSFAMLCLIISFIANDITVIFVRDHSHPLLPLLYRIGAAWGGHEGSLLLWCFILSSWTLFFLCFKDRAFSQELIRRMVSILGAISCGFLLFLIVTSNPFLRDFPKNPIEGADLVPLLQDPGLIFHPPMLYSGYVGFIIVFAMSLASLQIRRLDPDWARAIRPWVILPWCFLGCGIVLGSWWAYRELGWGGWWFWDPVENASLLPWLSATALIHSLIVTEKRQTFQGWTILLAIITFSLSLIGTFLVRSGVLVSVHAFANDPTRGLFLLIFLSVILGYAMVLYLWRIKDFYRAPHFALWSRETALLLNSVLLLTAVATILLGTLYPIILETLNIAKISVGEPYFNSVFIPLILPLLLLMVAAPHLHWQSDAPRRLWHKVGGSAVISILLTIILFYCFDLRWAIFPYCGIAISLWLILSTLHYAYRQKQHLSLKSLSMIVAHLGIALLTLGITINKNYSVERQVKLYPGETVQLASYSCTFERLFTINTHNYQSIALKFNVQGKYGAPKILLAEERIYRSHEQTLSKPGILYNLSRDIYIALGTPYDDGAWSVRLYYKPAVRWIWCGGFLTVLGGLCSLIHYLRQGRTRRS